MRFLCSYINSAMLQCYCCKLWQHNTILVLFLGKTLSSSPRARLLSLGSGIRSYLHLKFFCLNWGLIRAFQKVTEIGTCYPKLIPSGYHEIAFSQHQNLGVMLVERTKIDHRLGQSVPPFPICNMVLGCKVRICGEAGLPSIKADNLVWDKIANLYPNL